MELIWWQNEDHRARFVGYVRNWSYWQDIDVEGQPERFLKEYDFGLFFYVLSATGKSWSSRWIKVEREGDEDYQVLDGRKLLDDAGPWSSGERALARLALHLLNHDEYPVTVHECLDALSGAFAQVAQVAIALKFGQAKQPFWAHYGHGDDFFSLCSLQYPNHQDPAVQSAIYVLSALGKYDIVRPCLVKQAQGQLNIHPLHGPQSVEVLAKTQGQVLTETADGLVTGAGQFDYRKLQTSTAWFSFTKGERALARLAAYLQAPNDQINLTEIFTELDSTQLRVATDGLQIRFGRQEDQ